MLRLSLTALPQLPFYNALRACFTPHASRSMLKPLPAATFALALVCGASYVHADDMGILIAQKSMQAQIVSPTDQTNNHAVASHTPYRYPNMQRAAPAVLPEFLSGSYDNVDSEYLPLLSTAELQSSQAAREVISMARKMSLNERTIIQGGCWDYLNAVFNRAGVSRDTLHKGTYKQGPYANSTDIEAGDWLYYINHGYNDIEHSGLFVGWVDESAKQALILSYAGESRREPARYRVYDLSHVYQIMRPSA